MNRDYFNRYSYFESNGIHKIVPGITIPIKSTDKYFIFRKNKDRLDRISQDFYNSPTFGWLILLSNPSIGSLEFNIPNDFLLRIPYPLVNTLQDYKKNVDLYKLYNGE
jgi:hypothetical protein